MVYSIRIRVNTETEWVLENPILADGEPGYASDLNLYKIGDGVTAWSDLLYVQGPQGPAGPVGETGPAGPVVNVLGSVPDSGSLPVSATLGDGYLVTDPDPDELWIYGDNGWVFAGNAGVPGPPGPEGPVGPVNQEIVVSTVEPTDPEVDFWLHPTDNLDSWGLLDDRYATVEDLQAVEGAKVSLDGDVMTGPLTIDVPVGHNLFTMKSPDGSINHNSYIKFGDEYARNFWWNDIRYWKENFTDSGYGITRFDYLGNPVDTPFSISRGDGKVSVLKDPTSSIHVANKKYVDQHNASVRVRSTSPFAIVAGSSGYTPFDTVVWPSAGYSEYFALSSGRIQILKSGIYLVGHTTYFPKVGGGDTYYLHSGGEHAYLTAGSLIYPSIYVSSISAPPTRVGAWLYSSYAGTLAMDNSYSGFPGQVNSAYCHMWLTRISD